MNSLAITILDPAVGHPRTFAYEVHDVDHMMAVIRGTQDALAAFAGATITNIEVA